MTSDEFTLKSHETKQGQLIILSTNKKTVTVPHTNYQTLLPIAKKKQKQQKKCYYFFTLILISSLGREDFKKIFIYSWLYGVLVAICEPISPEMEGRFLTTGQPGKEL